MTTDAPARQCKATLPIAILLVFLILPPAEAGHLPAAFEVRIDAGTIDARSGPDVNITNTTTTSDGISLTISAHAPAVGEIIISSQFNVSSPRQIVPRIWGVILEERPPGDLANATGPAFNVSAEGERIHFDIALPVGEHALTLTHDTTPPVWQIDTPSDVTHNAAVVTSRTDEAALAVLLLDNPRVGTVAFSTPAPGGRQTFPLSGLDPETDYSFTITFEDFSGNTITSEPRTIRTMPRPLLPQPRISIVTPENGSTVSEPVKQIDARIEDAVSTVRTVSLYVDKTFVPDATRLLTGNEFRYIPPQALGPGRHTIVLEATNEAGGESRSTSTFIVAADSVPFPGFGLIATIITVSVLSRARTTREAEAGPIRRP